MEHGGKPDGEANDQALIFLHLPKCAGTTLNRIIEWEYNPMRVFSIDPVLFLWSYQKLNRWPAKRLAPMQVFKGHMPFGIHKRLPQPYTYITFLRDPVERAYSAHANHVGHGLETESFERALELEDSRLAGEAAGRDREFWARALAEGGPNALAYTKALLQQFSRQALSVEEAAKASAAAVRDMRINWPNLQWARAQPTGK